VRITMLVNLPGGGLVWCHIVRRSQAACNFERME
jgi:hypothetical protein